MMRSDMRAVWNMTSPWSSMARMTSISSLRMRKKSVTPAVRSLPLGPGLGSY